MPPDPKSTLRARVRRSRATRGAADADAAALARTASTSPALHRLLAAGTGSVLAYAAVPGEPDLAVLRDALRAAGTRVLLPVVTGPGTLRWGVDTGALRPGRELPGGLRLPEPDPTTAEPVEGLGLGPDDVVLVPALAVARDGVRLGQGGGYYDRALAGLVRTPSGPLVVAVVHDDELLAAGEVPAEPHDLRVDAVLTPSAWVVLPARR